MGQMNASNRKAFLDTIAISEGTYGIGDDGYNVLVGSTVLKPLLFTSYADHPRVFNRDLNSTAAGRYQLLSRYFTVYKARLNLPDFGHASQDAIAIQQITECQAIDDVDAGLIYSAIKRCNRIWASFPGSPYGQATRATDYLANAFTAAGGVVINNYKRET